MTSYPRRLSSMGTSINNGGVAHFEDKTCLDQRVEVLDKLVLPVDSSDRIAYTNDGKTRSSAHRRNNV
eukprot:CAMPEP_0184751830 /NCGR_PEP_ID=MMETSP0315-20130426/43257_1 /TAXON_ID=101924 /ORGANISM="Rhodosorus marinus, Strain UTEX LB 2760" /LENGTH=67 /DNA_ID=CAMNT_0027231127 /DNA_START=1237 /DNA_END=1440 /DNA_ORIENTATION=-